MELKRRGVRQKGRLRAHVPPGVERQESRGQGVHQVPARHKERGHRRAQLRQEGRQLGGQIGKRNLELNKQAVKTAKEIQKLDSKSARWIAADALKKLAGAVSYTHLTLPTIYSV